MRQNIRETERSSNPPFYIHPDIFETLVSQNTSFQWRHNEHDGVSYHQPRDCLLVYWGEDKKTSKLRVTGLCVGNSPVIGELTIIGSDNGLSPGRRQAIIWTNAGILLIGPLGTDFRENFIGIQTFSFKKMHLKISSGKWRPFCLGLNVLRNGSVITSQRSHGCISFIHVPISVYLS